MQLVDRLHSLWVRALLMTRGLMRTGQLQTGLTHTERRVCRMQGGAGGGTALGQPATAAHSRTCFHRPFVYGHFNSEVC